MTAQQLRNSILQQAIQGRLVPQDPNDEPASVLLERIRKEKEQLVKEGKLKKKDLVTTPIADEEIPFDIPSGWEWCRYMDIACCELGKTKNPSQTDGTMSEYLCSINVYWNKISLANVKQMLFTDSEKSKYLIKKGDMLICEGGETGRTAIWDRDDVEIFYQNALHRVRFYGGIESRFFMYQMMIYKDSGLLEEHVKGETIQHFVLGKLQNLPIPLPPLAEQRRIVAKIEELMPLVEKYGKAQSELDNLNQDLPRRLRQSVLQQAIQGKLVPLGEVAKIVTGSTPSKVNNNYYGSDYPFFKPGDLTHQYIKKSVDGLSCLGFEAARKLPPSTILVCCIGSLGKCSIIETEGSCNQQINAILPSESYDTKYLYYVIQSPNFIEQMWEKATSTTVTLLNKNKFSEIPIPLPPLAEQRRIVAKIEELFAEIDKLK